MIAAAFLRRTGLAIRISSPTQRDGRDSALSTRQPCTSSASLASAHPSALLQPLEPRSGCWQSLPPTVADKPVPDGRVSPPSRRAPSGRGAITLPLREYDPGYTRRFIGLSDPRPIFPPPDDQALEPAATPVRLPLDRPDHCPGSMDEQLPEGLCRKVGLWRQNPKIGCRKINDLRVSTFLFSVICDRAIFRMKLTIPLTPFNLLST